MRNIEEAAGNLNSYLLQLEVVKEFQKYEALILKDEKLKILEKEMKDLQKLIVRKKANQDASVVQTIVTYKALKQEFEEHPLFVNYRYLKQEVDMLLQEVNSRINGQL